MPDPETREEARAALEEARAFLEEALALRASGFPGPALRSGYYAMFHAARALLLARGVTARSHRGVLSEFHRVYVRGGEVDPELGGDFGRLLTHRLKSDYEAGVRVSEDEADWAVERAKVFVRTTGALLAASK